MTTKLHKKTDMQENTHVHHQDQGRLLAALRRSASDEQPLYGRDKEWTQLIKAYRSSTSKLAASSAVSSITSIDEHASNPASWNTQPSRKRLVLIRGSAGVGKSSLAQKLKREAKADGGWFISGKFDMLQQATPYSAFIQAFSEFACLLSREDGDDAKEEIVSALKVAVAEKVRNQEILTSMIPDLALLGLGEENGGSSPRPQDTERKADGRAVRTRFLTTFRNFLRAIGSLGCPLVLLLDDVHWAGRSSLELLGSLLDDSQIHHVLFVCTSETNMPSLEKYGPSVKTDVVLSNLSEADTHQALAAMLGQRGVSDDQFATESKHLYQVTQGHCALLRHVLLYEEECQDGTNSDDQKAGAESSALSPRQEDESDSTLEDVVRKRISLLPKNVQDVLLYAAFLGYDIHGDLLSMVLRVESVEPYLQVAESYGMIRYVPERRCYKFCHDSIQTGLLCTVPRERQPGRHLAIGRQLLKSMSNGDLEESIFVVLDQIRRGEELVVNQREQTTIATLCVVAASRAATASSFWTAATYLEFGIRLVALFWEEEYDLNLQLHNSCCEVQFVLGRFDRALDIFSVVAKHARCTKDEMRTRLMQVYILGADDQMVKALDVSMHTLRQVGHPIPSNPNFFQLLTLHGKVKKLLKGKSDGILMRMSLIQDKEKLSCMQILSLMLTSSYHSKRKFLLPYVTLRMMQLTIEDGVCSFSPFAFAVYGVMLIWLKDFDEGWRFAKLALALLERLDAVESSSRVYAIVYGLAFQWSVEYAHVIGPLWHGVKVGLETGDTEFATVNGLCLVFASLNNGASLPSLRRTILSIVDLVKNRGHSNFGALKEIQPVYQMVKQLTESSDNPSLLAGDVVDGEALVRDLEAQGHSNVHLWIRHDMCMLAYLFGDFERAESYGREAMQLLTKQKIGDVNLAMVGLFNGLAALAVCRNKRSTDRQTWKRCLASARRSLGCVRFISKHAPHNVLNRLKLLEAEYLAVTGKHEEAVEGFTIACALFADKGFELGSAIGYERWARYLMERKNGCHREHCEEYLRKALKAYRRWGAIVKVEHLMREFPMLRKAKTRTRASFYLPEQAV